MELKLEHNLPHQLHPVMDVADVVEATMDGREAEKKYQNPPLQEHLNTTVLLEVREREGLRYSEHQGK